jgi:hypothetical protein
MDEGGSITCAGLPDYCQINDLTKSRIGAEVDSGMSDLFAPEGPLSPLTVKLDDHHCHTFTSARRRARSNQSGTTGSDADPINPLWLQNLRQTMSNAKHRDQVLQPTRGHPSAIVTAER